MAYATLTAKIPSHQMEFIDELIKTGIAADRSAAIRGIIEAFIQEGRWEMPDVPKREKVAKKRSPKKEEAAEEAAEKTAKPRIVTEGQTLEESFEKVIEDTKRKSEQKNYFKKSNRPDFTGWTEEQIREYRRLFPEHFESD